MMWRLEVRETTNRAAITVDWEQLGVRDWNNVFYYDYAIITVLDFEIADRRRCYSSFIIIVMTIIVALNIVSIGIEGGPEYHLPNWPC